MENSKNNIAFFTINDFKSKVGATSLDVVKNPNGDNKLFVASSEGGRWKCQQNISKTKEMRFLVEDGDLDKACLVNVKETANNTVFTL